ncbi:vegetative cell wall protein gp1-like [Perognathus longimembris pacificus]|uniref:vegetative cell wall protein gp1-like n=1 Tax=Perognathus longimembris pacificus TaxID=214514 RepID=UPI002019F7FC|nr:vegetative cell wall protein gp1-like [Perognathus longimembris pacificus]
MAAQLGARAPGLLLEDREAESGARPTGGPRSRDGGAGAAAGKQARREGRRAARGCPGCYRRCCHVSAPPLSARPPQLGPAPSGPRPPRPRGRRAGARVQGSGPAEARAGPRDARGPRPGPGPPPATLSAHRDRDPERRPRRPRPPWPQQVPFPASDRGPAPLSSETPRRVGRGHPWSRAGGQGRRTEEVRVRS